MPDGLDESFTGVVLALTPGPEFTRGGRPRSALRSLAQRFTGARLGLAYVVLAGLALPALGLRESAVPSDELPSALAVALAS